MSMSMAHYKDQARSFPVGSESVNIETIFKLSARWPRIIKSLIGDTAQTSCNGKTLLFAQH